VSSLAVDPHLSVYHLVKRTKTLNAFLNNRQAMLLISYEIERALFKTRARVFAGFQHMSRFLPQEARYRKLAETSESVYVFGIMDVFPPPIAGIRYVPLRKDDQLAREWFLIADSPQYFSALPTEEVTPLGLPDEQRQFEGAWSFDEELVTILQEWLSSLVDAHPLGDLHNRRDYVSQIGMMNDSLTRMSTRLAKQTSQRVSGLS
jgi:DICT domain-containing protein